MKIMKVSTLILIMLLMASCASRRAYGRNKGFTNKSVNFASTYYDLAKYAGKRGDILLAIEYNSTAIEINPAYYDAYINRGVLYYEIEKYQNAFDDFSYVLKYKKDSVCLFDRGNIFYIWEKYTNAIEDFLEAVHINPDDSDSYTMLGNCYAKTKQYEEAKEYYKKALSINQNDVQAYNNLKTLQGR